MLALIHHFRNILSLVLTVLLSLWFLNRDLDGRLRIARGLQVTVLSPAQFVINKVNGMRSTLRENRELRETAVRLKTENDLLREMGKENDRLRAMLEYRALGGFSLIAAEVIAHKDDIASRDILISAGTLRGAQKDMPVISITGVVGRIIECYPFHSMVQLINDPSARTGVLFARINVPAILEYQNDVTPVVRLPAHHAVALGDTVLSSGLGGVFPKGLYIGRIKRIAPENDLYNTVEIELHQGIYHIENVFVLNIAPRWQAFEGKAQP